jgi:histidyl-tRNA synthetase
MLYQAPRGTTDILPEEQGYWSYVEQKVAEVSRLYGYERIYTPAFEDAGLFVRSVGENTDIVRKEMYTFADRGGNELTLRPEGTAPVCRAYLEHGMQNLPQPVKLYYTAAIFRYERPQAGRYREHHQFGFEAIGEADPTLDSEVIDTAWRLLRTLGLGDLSLQINSIGCKQCRPIYLNALSEYYAPYPEKLCPECQARVKRNPLRLLDCKNENCRIIADAAPKSTDYLCPECAAHFDRLKGYLEQLELPFTVNNHLVRGLDYYTRTVFEIVPAAGGAQSTIIGGGRYDDLIAELGGKPTPAIGFAAGIERVILNLKQQAIPVPPLPRAGVFIAHLGEPATQKAVALASVLRTSGIGVIQAPDGKSLKAQLRLANTLGVRFAVIIGEEEVATDTVVLRDMTGATQEKITADALAVRLKTSLQP